MNRDEDIARIYLESLGLGSIVHEPDGNRMPDFLVDRRIAVEVRRLNQHTRAGDRPEGLENVEAALVRYFDKLLPSLGSAGGTGSWWVSYHFQRPLDMKALKRDIPNVLRHFVEDRDGGRHTFTLQRNFEMDLQPTTEIHENRFLLGAYSDYDAGGFVGSEIIRNADLCIAEKTAKMLRVKELYPEWWLLLVDRIGPKLNEFERDDLPNHIDPGPWDRVILLDPRTPARALRLGSARALVRPAA